LITNSYIRSLKFAFEESFHNLKTNLNILVLKIVLDTGHWR